MKIVAAIVLLLLASCATAPIDYSLQWEDRSATLYVYSPDGSTLPAFGGELVTIPGYRFYGAIQMHPGEHSIGYACPRNDNIVVFDATPTVRFKFFPGRVYELRCNEGQPVVAERQKDA